MALADRFEQAGVLIGAVVVVPIPVGLLLNAFYGTAVPAWSGAVLVGSALLVGWLVATGRAPITYRELWYVGVIGGTGAMAVWFALGLRTPTSRPALALGTWALALLAADGLARLHLGRLLPN